MSCVENAASCVDSVISKFEASLSLLTAPVDPVGAALDVFAAYGLMTCTSVLFYFFLYGSKHLKF